MLFTPASALLPASTFARIAASGVAPEIPSYVKDVILPVKEISRKHLAASAGFIKFCPSPPNSCFTTRIANTLPRTPIQSGAVGGRFSASRSPVTTAPKNPDLSKSKAATFSLPPSGNLLQICSPILQILTNYLPTSEMVPPPRENCLVRFILLFRSFPTQ